MEFFYFITFFIFKFALIGSTLFLVMVSRTVLSVFILISAFILASAISIFLGATFLGMLMVIVYVGAVAVLFLFVTMMLGMHDQEFQSFYFFNIPVSKKFKNLITSYPKSFFVGFFFFFNFYLVFCFSRLTFLDSTATTNSLLVNHFTDASNIFVIGSILYTYYFFPFLVSSLILLVAMVGAIFLTSGLSSSAAYKQDITSQIETLESESFYMTGAKIHSVKKFSSHSFKKNNYNLYTLFYIKNLWKILRIILLTLFLSCRCCRFFCLFCLFWLYFFGDLGWGILVRFLYQLGLQVLVCFL